MAEHLPPVDLIRRAYTAFNARDLDSALSALHRDVDWLNAIDGGAFEVTTRSATSSAVIDRVLPRVRPPTSVKKGASGICPRRRHPRPTATALPGRLVPSFLQLKRPLALELREPAQAGEPLRVFGAAERVERADHVW